MRIKMRLNERKRVDPVVFEANSKLQYDPVFVFIEHFILMMILNSDELLHHLPPLFHLPPSYHYLSSVNLGSVLISNAKLHTTQKK